MQLNLTLEEVETLQKILENHLSDLRGEIVHTDRMAYREKLKAERQVIEHILDGMQVGMW